MAQPQAPIRYCRFIVDGHSYFGKIRENMVDILEGDLFSSFSEMRMSYPLEQVKFLMPFEPKTIWCVGRNYLGHIRELDHEVPEEPCIFLKPLTALIGPEEPVRIPAWAGRVDYEGELVVIIGKRCHRATEEDALDYVLGYSCMNDVTARELQNKDGQWARAKGFNTFAPFGPCVLLTKEMPPKAQITTRLNGNVVQQDTFDNMIFSVARIISHISRFTTLNPGDIIATGTPEGVGPVRPGERVEINIDGIGSLSNPFIADI